LPWLHRNRAPAVLDLDADPIAKRVDAQHHRRQTVENRVRHEFRNDEFGIRSPMGRVIDE
jgi:hypothetical protein